MRSTLPALLVAGAVLVALALTSGAQFTGDPFGHYDVAARRGFDLRYVVLDTWTRPIPNLLFAPGRFLGVERVFVIPIVLTLASVFLAASVIDRFVGGNASTFVVAVPPLLHHGVLETGYVTMTEAPFLLAASAAAWAFYRRGATTLACLFAGLLPLCRSEGLAIAPALGLAFIASSRPKSVVAALAALAAPLAAWQVAGIALTGDVLWYVHANSYLGVASFRDGPAPWMAVCNGITMVARTFPALLLPCLVLGVFARRNPGDPPRAPLVALLLTPILVLTFVRVGPDAWADFHAAGLTRMYVTMAPAAAVFIAVGLRRLFSAEALTPAVHGAFGCALLMLVAAIPFGILVHAGWADTPMALYARAGSTGGFSTLVTAVIDATKLDRHWLRLAALAMLVGLSWFALAHRRSRAMIARAADAAGLLRGDRPWRSAIATLLLVPFLAFTFPSSWQRLFDDPRDERRATLDALAAFGTHYRGLAPNRPDVIQRVVHDLAGFCGVDASAPGAPKLGWSWNVDLAAVAADARPGTLVLAGIDEQNGELAWFYGHVLRACGATDRSFTVDTRLGRRVVIMGVIDHGTPK